MSTLSYNPSLNKVSDSKYGKSAAFKICINHRPIIELSLNRPQKGGQGLGKKHRIIRLYVDSDYRVFAKYILKDAPVTNSEQFALIGKMVQEGGNNAVMEAAATSLRTHSASVNTDENQNIYAYFTHSALEDKLLYVLLSSKNGRFYYAQADFFLNKINLYKPLPVFKLFSSDIPEPLAREIDNLGEQESDRLITNVVRRIYQSIDSEYFHVNGIHGKVKWFIEEDKS